MIFGNGNASALARAQDKHEQSERERKASPKEDKPCARCGHLCSAHAPANYTRMFCKSEGCTCNSYFPSKSYEAVVTENIALHQEIERLKAELDSLTRARTVSA